MPLQDYFFSYGVPQRNRRCKCNALLLKGKPTLRIASDMYSNSMSYRFACIACGKKFVNDVKQAHKHILKTMKEHTK